MSISGFAKSDDLEKYWSPDHLTEESDRLEITSTKRKRVEVTCENYPFPHQILLYGGFVFHLDGRREFEPTLNGHYLYRPASGLFIVEIRQNNADVERVIEEFNSVIGDATEIQRIKSISRESLWRFLENAEQISEIQFRGPDGRKTLRAEIRGEDHRLGNHELTDNLDSHLIVSARASFRKPGTDQRLALQYNKGRFEIPSNTAENTEYILDDVAEYVVQLIERDILQKPAAE